jgi:hypothetical protein
MMTKILDLANYTNVVRRKELIKELLEVMELDSAAYMPTTRDLSAEKRSMIIEWLESSPPPFDRFGTQPVPGKPECAELPPVLCSLIMKRAMVAAENPYCNMTLDFGKESDRIEDMTRRVLGLTPGTCDEQGLCDQYSSQEETLQGCNDVEELKDMLQDALHLEWATIPVYLTSLYSITEGCNYEIYELIESVVREEMLHFTQVANTLIAMGERPQIDVDAVSFNAWEYHFTSGWSLAHIESFLGKAFTGACSGGLHDDRTSGE